MMTKKIIATLLHELNGGQSIEEYDWSLLNSVPSNAPQYIECRLDCNKQLDHLYCIDNEVPLSHFPLSKWEYDLIQHLRCVLPEIPYIWVEHDDIRHNKATSKSCIHACVAPNYLRPFADVKSISKEQVLTVIEALRGSKINMDIGLEKTISIMIENAYLIHVSCMHSRIPTSTKFFVKVNIDEVKDLLNLLGWPGDYQSLDTLLEKPWLNCKQNRTVSLDLKWEGSITSYLGVVCSKITLDAGLDGINRVSSLIESDEINQDVHMKSIIGWLPPKKYVNPFRWIDVKSSINENNNISTKIYFGIQHIEIPILKNITKGEVDA